MNITLHILGKRVHITDAAPQVIAAGILFVADDEILIMKRSEDSNHPGLWDLPGGKADDGDKSIRATAIRECREECGISKDFDRYVDTIKEISHTKDGQADYTTFMLRVDKFEPKLSPEHSKFKWIKLHELPDDLHPHLRDTLEALVLELL